MIRTLITLVMLAGGGLWLVQSYPPVKQLYERFIQKSDCRTLEVRFTAEQIIEKQRDDVGHILLPAELRFYPYALLEVKYSKNAKTREALMLWSLENGEMILNTKTWESSHGLQDCLTAAATHLDFKLLKALSKQGGVANKLTAEFHDQIDSCRKKKLIVQKGNEYRLHFDAPRFPDHPETRSPFCLTTKMVKSGDVVSPRYSLAQIAALAEEVFDSDFTIRSSSQVYLPVYCLTVKTADGSLMTTYWNALNGKELKLNNI